MTLTTLQQYWIPRIDNELQDIIGNFDFDGNEELKTMLQYHMGWVDGKRSGKRLRPFLTLLCTGALGADPEKVLPGALAVELLHNFTLIHDDIEDNSDMRHGRSTVWQRWGIPLAINAGDALFSIAQLALLDLQDTLGSESSLMASGMFNKVCVHLTCGQHMDITFEMEESVTEADYLKMVRGKTAALIGFAAWLSGLAAAKDERTLSSLYSFGENLGLAFQMQDDLLGIWGNPQVTGKSSASDLQNKKKTLPVIHGLAQCPEFKKLWQNPQIKTNQISRMAEILQACGGKEAVQNHAAIFTQAAFNSLNDLFDDHNDYTKSLFDLTRNLLHRDF